MNLNFFSSLAKTAKATVSAVQQWQAFANKVKPNADFDLEKIPASFDYSSLASWAAHPAKTSKAGLVPLNEMVAADPKADVFYIHPTTYFGQDNWNQPPGLEPACELVDEMVLPAQASVFNGSCRVFAPRYRQGTFYVFLSTDKNSDQALHLAFSDVVKSFRYYLEHFNEGRPFFIAGHSQGSLHAVRLLEEVIEPDEQLVRQMVAAYPIGFQFPIDKFDRTLKNIRPSTSPTDLHSVIAWDTFGGNTNPKNPIDRSRYFYPDKKRWEMRYKKNNFGVNPLSFSNSVGIVDASHNLGAVHVNYDVPFRHTAWWGGEKIGMQAINLSPPEPAIVSAELRNNQFVYISEPKNRLFKIAMMPGNNYHNYDYSLFYMNLRKNIAERLDAYLNAI
ncbi:MAG: DUF3089 domain-containing protein [Saprospiraceae bacterium]